MLSFLRPLTGMTTTTYHTSRKRALPVQGGIRSVSSKNSFLIFLFICATAVIKKKKQPATMVTDFI